MSDEQLDELATEKINEVLPDIYKAADRAGISYSDEMIALAMTDAFKFGYRTAEQKKSEVPK